MIEKVFKVGDTITIKRTSQAGTGYRYALVRLTGGVALVEELSEDADTPGGTSVQSFIFRFLQPGQVEIQFAYYRDSEEVLYEDVFSYVSGYNYRFICMTESLIREPKYGFAKVTIYAPLRGEPILESIIEC